MSRRSISLKVNSGAPPERAIMRRPISSPKRASIPSGSSLRPGFTCPPLRPEAPQPGVSASRSVTAMPCSARWRAADNPVKPPPITATSVSASPASGDQEGKGLDVAVQRELEITSHSFAIMRFLPGYKQLIERHPPSRATRLVDRRCHDPEDFGLLVALAPKTDEPRCLEGEAVTDTDQVGLAIHL